MLLIVMRRQDLKLPRLPPIDVPQAFFVDLQLTQIDHARHRHILLHPRILDGLGAHAIQPLRQVAKRAMAGSLHGQNVLHLLVGQDALLDQ